MFKVISFGEALVDLLSNKVNNDSADAFDNSAESFAKFPGGAPANVAAAVSRLGGDAYFAGMLGDDMFGNFIAHCLYQEGVKLDYLSRTKDAKTGLAFVSLDAERERSFEFYRHPSADMLFTSDHFPNHCFDGNGIFHFCSNTLTCEGLYDATLVGLKRANAAQWLCSFDVNLRLNLWANIDQAMPAIWQCFDYADLVKMSLEELEFVAGDETHETTLANIMAAGVKLIIITDGGHPLRYFSAQGHGEMVPLKVQMVDATAAGDAFVGGLLFSLAEQEVTPADFEAFITNSAQLETSVRFASACGAYAVQRQGAISSLPRLGDVVP
ncbi:MAG TPA: carbohydrate kinase [Oceanospirillaceae bacterium]|nr:carbohydrate kinase [Oceanospirillaceae bacterium]